MKSQDFINYFDDFAKSITEQTLVVLDNASIYKSNEVKAKIDYLETRDLHLFFLPPYSPELNKIETLWRKSKYECICFHAFFSFVSLGIRLSELIKLIGHKYIINFA